MTVSELIVHLQQLPQDALCVVVVDNTAEPLEEEPGFPEACDLEEGSPFRDANYPQIEAALPNVVVVACCKLGF